MQYALKTLKIFELKSKILLPLLKYRDKLNYFIIDLAKKY